MKRIVTFTIAEPSDVIREGLAAVLTQVNAGFRIFQVRDVSQLDHHLLAEKPDVLVVDPALPGVSPAKLRAKIGRPDMLCVALVTNLRGLQDLQGFDRTVSVFDDFEQLRENLGKLAPRRTESSESEKSLSRRETEIVAYVVKGLTNKQIADKLCLSQHTVITHRRNIANKLQIHSSAGLVIYAIANKLVKLEEVK